MTGSVTGIRRRRTVAGRRETSHLPPDRAFYGQTLYIGKALDLKKRFKQHANPPEGLNASGKVEIDDLDDYLCDPDKAERKCFYAYARLDGRSLKKCEAAMIKQFQPVINIKAKKSLGCHDESYFKIEGQYVYDVVQKGTYHVKKDNQ